MKAKPILMHQRSIRNLLNGRKTQTRRIMKPQPNYSGEHGLCFSRPDHPGAYNCLWGPPLIKQRCPYGTPGDLIWVREAHRFFFENHGDLGEGRDHISWGPAGVLYLTDDGALDDPEYPCGDKRPSIHMPRWASRLTLHLTDIHVERVQEISADDAIDEGCDAPMPEPGPQAITQWRDHIRRDFQVLWEDTNGTLAWARNDWVWVLCFDVIKANIDDVLADPERYGVAEAA